MTEELFEEGNEHNGTIRSTIAAGNDALKNALIHTKMAEQLMLQHYVDNKPRYKLMELNGDLEAAQILITKCVEFFDYHIPT